VEDALKEIPIGAQVPRIAFVDVAFPRSGPEFTALGGFAAVLVCAFARDGRELPPERVVARTGTASADLPLAARQEKQIPAGAVADVFGARRVDSVYLLPVFATVVDTTITVHFRVSARALDALRFPLPENEGHIPAGVDLAAPVRDPQWDALEKLIHEELPLMGPNALLSP